MIVIGGLLVGRMTKFHRLDNSAAITILTSAERRREFESHKDGSYFIGSSAPCHTGDGDDWNWGRWRSLALTVEQRSHILASNSSPTRRRGLSAMRERFGDHVEPGSPWSRLLHFQHCYCPAKSLDGQDFQQTTAKNWCLMPRGSLAEGANGYRWVQERGRRAGSSISCRHGWIRPRVH